jgi:hypothetical protein
MSPNSTSANKKSGLSMAQVFHAKLCTTSYARSVCIKMSQNLCIEHYNKNLDFVDKCYKVIITVVKTVMSLSLFML